MREKISNRKKQPAAREKSYFMFSPLDYTFSKEIQEGEKK